MHQRCADISKGYVQKGALLCVDCRLQAMGAEGQPAESLLNEVAQLAVIELTEGREATSSTHSAFVTFTEKWVAEKLQQGVRRIASPTENKESFKNFANNDPHGCLATLVTPDELHGADVLPFNGAWGNIRHP